MTFPRLIHILSLTCKNVISITFGQFYFYFFFKLNQIISLHFDCHSVLDSVEIQFKSNKKSFKEMGLRILLRDDHQFNLLHVQLTIWYPVNICLSKTSQTYVFYLKIENFHLRIYAAEKRRKSR